MSLMYRDRLQARFVVAIAVVIAASPRLARRGRPKCVIPISSGWVHVRSVKGGPYPSEFTLSTELGSLLFIDEQSRALVESITARSSDCQVMFYCLVPALVKYLRLTILIILISLIKAILSVTSMYTYLI